MRVAILYDAAAARPDATADVSGVLEAVEAVDGALRLRGHEPVRVPVEKVEGEWLQSIRTCDAVFNLCENVGGVSAAEVEVARAIEDAGIPMTGSGAAALELCRRKDRANTRLAEQGLPVPDWALVDAGRLTNDDWQHWPAIVKPSAEDASVGITQQSFARDAAALAGALEHAAPFAPLIVQHFVEGRELNVGIVGRSVLPIAEIDFSGMPADAWHAVTYAAKWDYGSEEDEGTHPRCPAELPEALSLRATKVAIDAVAALGVTGYARVDLRLDEADALWVLDVNPNPDLAPSAGLARMGRAAGWAYDELVERILQEGVGRQASGVRDGVSVQSPGDGVARVGSSARRPTPDARLGPVERRHLPQLESLLQTTNVFRPEEIAVALEVMDAYLRNPGQDYDAVGAFTRDDRLLGYACFGATPCTERTFDLYWIAVSPEAQGRGIGTLIMQEVERRLERADARLVLIETSSTEPYAPTRAFYRALGYREVARVPDFYLDGDDRVILARRLDARDDADNASNESTTRESR